MLPIRTGAFGRGDLLVLVALSFTLSYFSVGFLHHACDECIFFRGAGAGAQIFDFAAAGCGCDCSRSPLAGLFLFGHVLFLNACRQQKAGT